MTYSHHLWLLLVYFPGVFYIAWLVKESMKMQLYLQLTSSLHMEPRFFDLCQGSSYLWILFCTSWDVGQWACLSMSLGQTTTPTLLTVHLALFSCGTHPNSNARHSEKGHQTLSMLPRCKFGKSYQYRPIVLQLSLFCLFLNSLSSYLDKDLPDKDQDIGDI